ncbi:hypothetical protein A2U01_0104022, partial [Trifolium medium]|nr:hypothetical protein [Trifolium medium]
YAKCGAQGRAEGWAEYAEGGAHGEVEPGLLNWSS